ncbi:hypothetical protein BUE80_DR010038 [Diplocarpon rosae]|nr:hypothetical protein BUE80_DR010038 [Diplocarpon rosae]
MSSKPRGAGKRRAEDTAPRTNTASSVRGKSISQPFPLPHDDEFPIRTPGTGIALPLDAGGAARLRISTAASDYDSLHQTGIAVSDFSGTRSPSLLRKSPPPPPEAQFLRHSQGRKPNQPSGLTNSVTSVPGSNVELSQKKKSSMKSVLGRLFGRKRKDLQPPRTAGRAEQHRSDPSALKSNTQGTTSSPKRSASMPINEFNRALRSHSIIVEDLFQHTGHEGDTTRDHAPGSSQGRIRRATTTSRIWMPNTKQGYGQDWTGLSPRPASSYARGSKDVSDAEAIETNGGAGISGNIYKRRSRSHGELQEASRRQGITRRRSDEIRYWRESYDPGLLSPMSSNRPETEEHVPDEVEDTCAGHVPQYEPFNFELAGMRITQAASLEQRVQQLEDRMIQMERAVSRIRQEEPLQLHDPSEQNLARYRSSSGTRPATRQSGVSLPKRHRYRDTQAQGDFHSSSQGSQFRSSSRGSSRPSRPSTSRHVFQPPGPDMISSTTFVRSEVPPGSARPLSTPTTIRGIPSSSLTLPTEKPLTGEHYNALTNMIVAEQSARQRLESVVLGLQRQLQTALKPGTAGGVDDGNFPGFEQDESSDDGRFVHEEFRTPFEERSQFIDEIFSEGPSKVADETSAPRTLSLSQITMGRRIPPSLNT